MEAIVRAEKATSTPQFRHLELSAAQFIVRADVEPSVLARVLQPFALRNLTPHRVTCHQHHDGMHIDLVVAGLSTREMDHLEARLNQLVPVHSVTLRRGSDCPL